MYDACLNGNEFVPIPQSIYYILSNKAFNKAFRPLKKSGFVPRGKCTANPMPVISCCLSLNQCTVVFALPFTNRLLTKLIK